MNKSIKSILRGYILFRSCGRYFITYNAAHAHMLTATSRVINLDGLHVFNGWCRFWLSIKNPDMISDKKP